MGARWGESDLNVAGERYRLAFSWRAIAALEAESGVAASDALKRLDAPTVTDLRLMLWALLDRHHHDLVLEDVGRLVADEAGLGAAAGAIRVAMRSGLPEKAGKRRGESSWRVSEVLTQSARAGMTVEAFWDSTPRETAILIAAGSRRLRELAFHIEACHRTKQLKWETAVGRDGPRERQTEDQMRDALRAWAKPNMEES